MTVKAGGIEKTEEGKELTKQLIEAVRWPLSKSGKLGSLF